MPQGLNSLYFFCFYEAQIRGSKPEEEGATDVVVTDDEGAADEEAAE